MALVLTGIVRYTELNTAGPMADALKMVIGFVVYFAYGYRNSRLARGRERPSARR